MKKTKARNFEQAFQKSLDLLANGEGIKKTLAQIGMAWGPYWRGVSNTPECRAAYVAALEARDEYRKLLAADRLADAALADPREAIAAGEVATLRTFFNTAAICHFADFMHRRVEDTDQSAADALQQAFRLIREDVGKDAKRSTPAPVSA